MLTADAVLAQFSERSAQHRTVSVWVTQASSWHQAHDTAWLRRNASHPAGLHTVGPDDNGEGRGCQIHDTFLKTVSSVSHTWLFVSCVSMRKLSMTWNLDHTSLFKVAHYLIKSVFLWFGSSLGEEEEGDVGIGHHWHFLSAGFVPGRAQGTAPDVSDSAAGLAGLRMASRSRLKGSCPGSATYPCGFGQVIW